MTFSNTSSPLDCLTAAWIRLSMLISIVLLGVAADSFEQDITTRSVHLQAHYEY